MQVQILRDNAIIPQKAHPTDAGLDLYSCGEYILYIGETLKVYTGIAVALPKDTVGLILDRSSLASKGLHIFGGVIDEDYRGELIVCLTNVGYNDEYRIHTQDKIAQLVIMPRVVYDITLVETLENTQRGNNGFGSSGR